MALLLRSLAGRLLVSGAAVFAGVLALGAVAALAEGRPPDPAALARLGGPLAACLGAAWVLAGFRQAGGDVALAGLGRRPVVVPLFLGLVAAPAGLTGPAGERPAAAWSLEAAPGTLRVGTPAGPLDLTWGPDGARRPDLPDPFPGLPPPGVAPVSAPPPARWPAAAVRAALLLLLLLWLGGRRPVPGLAATVGGAGATFALGQVAAAWLALRL